MYCKNCGNNLPDNAVFCTNCGHKIVLPTNESTTQPLPMQSWNPSMNQSFNGQNLQQPMHNFGQNNVAAKRKPIPFITKFLILEVIALALFAGLFFTKLKEYTSPERVAKSFFTTIMAGDYDDAYEMLSIEESDFVNKESFKNVVMDIGNENISNFEIEDVTTNKNTYTKQIIISYRIKEDTEDYYFTLYLDKSSSKKFFFFDDWEVNIGDYIKKDISISVLEDSTVSIAGKTLDNKYITGPVDEYGYVLYTIPKMFSTTYDVLITNPIYCDCSMPISITDDGNVFYQEYECAISMKSEITKQLLEQAKSDFKILWNGASKQNTFSSLNSLKTASYITDMENDYSKLMYKFSDGNTPGISDVTFGEFEVATSMDTVGTNYTVPYINVSLTASFGCTWLEEDWWTGDMETVKGNGDYSAQLCYIYENGEWVLSDIDIADFYYY